MAVDDGLVMPADAGVAAGCHRDDAGDSGTALVLTGNGAALTPAAAAAAAPRCDVIDARLLYMRNNAGDGRPPLTASIPVLCDRAMPGCCGCCCCCCCGGGC